MDSFKSSATTLSRFLIITFPLLILAACAGYYGGTAWQEHRAAGHLRRTLGYLPGEKNPENKRRFNRSLDFYTISRNTPNFIYQALDSSFSPAHLQSDTNGFITGQPELQRNKPAGTIRIFISGGSAAFGSIQNHSAVHEVYPQGTYSYEASIAGYLRQILSQRYPRLRFEVINAAVVQHQFHQQFAAYFEKIHDFHPDIIISMDGWNDAGLFVCSATQGDPYRNTDMQVEEELTVELLSRYSASYSALWQILRSRQPSAGPMDTPPPPQPPISIAGYQRLEPMYAANSGKLLWLMSAYLRQLQMDSVYPIVSLQPMLCRRVMNKRLSPLEQRFRDTIEAAVYREAVGSFDKIILARDQHLFQGMGAERYHFLSLVEAFFFDRYFSPRLDSTVTQAGGTYIDLGREIQGLGPSQEFFVDYCHMTPYGNHYIAGIFAHSVSDYLIRSGRVRTGS